MPGADVAAGSSTIVVQGGRPLHDCEHTIIADRIVAATYLSRCCCGRRRRAAAAAGLSPPVYRDGGAERSGLYGAQPYGLGPVAQRWLPARHPVRCGRRPIPASRPDAQAVLMAALLKAKGHNSLYRKNIFENRYRHVDEPTMAGAGIRTEGRVAVVCGVGKPHGAQSAGNRLRGGAALAVAALTAEGEKPRFGVAAHRPGLCRSCRRPGLLGADIVRVDETEKILI